MPPIIVLLQPTVKFAPRRRADYEAEIGPAQSLQICSWICAQLIYSFLYAAPKDGRWLIGLWGWTVGLQAGGGVRRGGMHC